MDSNQVKKARFLDIEDTMVGIGDHAEDKFHEPLLAEEWRQRRVGVKLASVDVALAGRKQLDSLH